MDQVSPGAPSWRRSGFCGESMCVEVALIGDQIGLRDAKNVAGPVLLYTGAEWRAFVDGVKSGHFDDLYFAAE